MTTIKEEFHPGIKHALASNFRNWKEAVLELLDNAVSDRIQGQELQVKVLSGPELLEISNSGGRAMDIAGLQTMFSWGQIKDRNSWDIGAYSQGGKAAMAYLGSAVEIVTSPQGATTEYRISDPDLRAVAQKEYTVAEHAAADAAGHVKVTLRDLSRKIKGEEIEQLISDYYRPLVMSGEVVFSVNGKTVSCSPFPTDTSRAPEQFKVSVGGGSLAVIGWVGRLEPRSGLRGGLRVYKKGRLIVDQQYFDHPDSKYKQSLNLLFGEVHFDHVTATTNKTGFDQDSPAWVAASKVVYDILKPHIAELLGRESDGPSQEEKDRVEQARQLVAELMRQRQATLGTNPVDGAAFGQKARTKKEAPDHPPLSNPTGRTNNPRTPPPPNASGRRRRLNEFIDWEVRAFDEKVRSIIQTTDQGAKKLVINSEFPAYRLSYANGHQLYLIETAALQLCKSADPKEMTSEEYSSAFDELYAFFCENLGAAHASIKGHGKKRVTMKAPLAPGN